MTHGRCEKYHQRYFLYLDSIHSRPERNRTGCVNGVKKTYKFHNSELAQTACTLDRVFGTNVRIDVRQNMPHLAFRTDKNKYGTEQPDLILK